MKIGTFFPFCFNNYRKILCNNKQPFIISDIKLNNITHVSFSILFFIKKQIIQCKIEKGKYRYQFMYGVK